MLDAARAVEPVRMQRRTALRAALAVGVALAGAGCATSTPVAPSAGMAISKTPLIGKFVWRDLMTDDPALVKPFYAGLFGWEYEERVAEGRPYTLVKSGGRFIGGIAKAERQAPGQPNAQWLSFMSVADVDQAQQRTRDAGGKVLRPAFDVPKVGRAAIVLDPQGAPLGLVRASFGDPADAPLIKRILVNAYASPFVMPTMMRCRASSTFCMTSGRPDGSACIMAEIRRRRSSTVVPSTE